MSTARHQFAGAPGTGTTLDNMGSRAKSWMKSSMSTTVPVLQNGMNVASLVDGGVGVVTANFTSVMANTTYCYGGAQTTAAGKVAITTAPAATGFALWLYDAAVGAVDPTGVSGWVFGDLA